jgi:hypothetical protein
MGDGRRGWKHFLPLPIRVGGYFPERMLSDRVMAAGWRRVLARKIRWTITPDGIFSRDKVSLRGCVGRLQTAG